MKAKHIIGIILYSLEALFFLLILIGSPSAMSIIDAAMAGNHSDNPAVNAAYTLLKTALVAILIYGLIRWALGLTVTGWTSLLFSIWVLGGLQLLMLGIVGEYVGKTYLETKRRPRYIVSETLLK